MSASVKVEEHSRSITIRAISFIFLVNFINIYSQIDLLWGKKGILSVDYLFEMYEKVNSNDFSKSFFPSIIPLLHKIIGISGETCLYIISTLGAILSFLMLFEKKFHKSIYMFLVWYSYLNIFLVGQHFTSFGFDHFNLEVGFISIFLCEFYTFDSKYLQIMSKYILKLTIFKVLYSFGLSLIFSNNKYILSLQGYESFLLKNFIPSSTIVILNKYIPQEFQTLLTALIFLVVIIVPFGMFCFFKRISRISGFMIAIFCLNINLIGNFGLSNLMLFAINFVNFDDDFLDLLFRLGEEKKIKLKDDRIINIPNEEELPAAIAIDAFCAFIFCLISLFTIFPLNKIVEGKFDLTPGGDKNPYKFFNINYLKKIFVLLVLYIIVMPIVDYYYEHLKKEEEFKYVKTFNDLKNSCKVGIIIKIIFFSIIACIYLCHSIDTFFSGLNLPMITKKKGSFLYFSNHKLFNTLHDFTISSGYQIHKGFLEERSHTGRDVLVFKYLTETIIYEDIKVNKTNQTNTLNETNTNNTILNNTAFDSSINITSGQKNNESNNKTNNESNNKINIESNNKTKKARKKKEWKSMQFKHQLNEKGNNNLYFFMKLLFKQPRLEYALHFLAYEDKIGMKNLSDKIWIPHLIYKIFNEKQKEENITKIKIDKIRYSFSKYSDDHFRTNFISSYLDDTNLTIIEDYLKKYNSYMIRDNENNFFSKIPFALIMYTLIIIFALNKINKLIPEESNNKDKEEKIGGDKDEREKETIMEEKKEN